MGERYVMCNSKRNQCLSLINCLENNASVNRRYPLAEEQGQLAFMWFEKQCYGVQCRSKELCSWVTGGSLKTAQQNDEKGLLKFSCLIGFIIVQTVSSAMAWFMRAAGHFPDRKSPSNTTQPPFPSKYHTRRWYEDETALCLIIFLYINHYVSVLVHMFYINVGHSHTEGGICLHRKQWSL